MEWNNNKINSHSYGVFMCVCERERWGKGRETEKETEMKRDWILFIKWSKHKILFGKRGLKVEIANKVFIGVTIIITKESWMQLKTGFGNRLH